MSSGLYVRNRVLRIRQFIYMLRGSTSSQVKMLCIKFFCSSLQLSRLKVKRDWMWWACPKMSSTSLPGGGMTRKSEMTAVFRICRFSSTIIASSYGVTSFHLRCSASLPCPGEFLPSLEVLFTDRETESKSIDPSPQKSVADHPEPQHI